MQRFLWTLLYEHIQYLLQRGKNIRLTIKFEAISTWKNYSKICKPVALFPSSLDDFTADDLAKMQLSIIDRWQQIKFIQTHFLI